MEIEKVASNRDNVFNSFEIYDNAHAVGMDLMKVIATFTRSGFDFDKPNRLDGLFYSSSIETRMDKQNS